MILDRDDASKQDTEFVQSTDNVPKSGNRRLPYISISRNQQSTSDSSQQHSWNTVDTDIHVRRDADSIERPQTLQVLPEPPVHFIRATEKCSQQSNYTSDQSRFHKLTRYRDHDEESVHDSQIRGRVLENKSGRMPLRTDVYSNSLRNEDSYHGSLPPSRFTPPPRYLPERQAEYSQYERVIPHREVTFSTQRYTDEERSAVGGVTRRQDPLHTAVINFDQVCNPTAQRTTHENDEVCSI